MTLRHPLISTNTGRCLAGASLAAVLAALATGCARPELPSLPDIPGVYRIDVQQGNVVTQEMLNKLEYGMPPRTVRFILGTPMVADPFNQNRWDYVYTFQEGRSQATRQQVSLYFQEGGLVRIEGDLQEPSKTTEDGEQREEMIVSVPRKPRRGILDAFTPDFLSSEPKRVEPEADAGDESGEETAPSGVTQIDTAFTPGAADVTTSGPVTGAEPAPVTDVEREDEPGLFERLLSGFGDADEDGREDAQSPASDDVESDQAAREAPTLSAIDPDDAKPDPAAVPDPAADDAYLRQLFDGFGTRQERLQEAEAGGDPSSSRTVRASAESGTDEARETGEEAGFFRKLIKKFNLDEESEERPDDRLPKPPEDSLDPYRQADEQ